MCTYHITCQNIELFTALQYFMIWILSGGVLLSKSQSQRIVTSFIWLYIIVIITVYVGNLVSFLSVTVTNMPFQTLEEMVEDGTYTWGAEHGAIYDMFKVKVHTVPTIVLYSFI